MKNWKKHISINLYNNSLQSTMNTTDILLMMWGTMDIWIALSLIFNINYPLHKSYCDIYQYGLLDSEKLTIGYYIALNGFIRVSHFWYSHIGLVIASYLLEASYHLLNHHIHIEHSIVLFIVNCFVAYTLI